MTNLKHITQNENFRLGEVDISGIEVTLNLKPIRENNDAVIKVKYNLSSYECVVLLGTEVIKPNVLIDIKVKADGFRDFNQTISIPFKSALTIKGLPLIKKSAWGKMMKLNAINKTNITNTLTQVSDIKKLTKGNIP